MPQMEGYLVSYIDREYTKNGQAGAIRNLSLIESNGSNSPKDKKVTVVRFDQNQLPLFKDLPMFAPVAISYEEPYGDVKILTKIVTRAK
jgi:hypothetical protein